MSESRITGHVTKEQLAGLLAGSLGREEAFEVLEHVETCSYCAEQFADCLEDELLTPPAYLREEILERSRCMDIRTARTVRALSKRMRFWLYSLKVGLAVAISLLLLFSSASLDVMKMPLSGIEWESEMPSGNPGLSVTGKLNQGSELVNQYLKKISDWLPRMEYEENWDD